MRSLGYRTTLHLYAAFVLSGALASLAGVLYVYYNRFVNPVAASFQISVEVALMAIVGGSGTILGPFIGAGIILGLRNWVSELLRAARGGDGRRVHRHRAVGAARASWASSTALARPATSGARRMSAPRSRSTTSPRSFGGLHAVDGVSLAVAPASGAR